MLRAPSPRRRDRRFGAAAASGRSLLSAMLIAGLVWAPLGTGASAPLDGTPAHAETAGDAPREAVSAAGELDFAPQEPVLAADDESYIFTAHLRSTGEDALAAGRLEVRLADGRIEDAERLTALLSGDAATVGPDRALLTTVEVGETAPGEGQELTIAIPRAAMPLGFQDDAGVYAVRADFVPATQTDGDAGTDGEGSDGEGTGDDTGTRPPSTEEPLLSTTTPVVWRGVTAGASVRLTLIVPLLLPGEVTDMPTQDQLSQTVPRLSALLDAAERWDATLAVDPRLIAGIRAHGDAAPAAAREFLDRLAATALPQFLLQFADADPAAQAALGFEQLLQPTGLSYATANGSFPAEPSDPTKPTDPGDGTNPDGSSGTSDVGSDAEDDAEDDAIPGTGENDGDADTDTDADDTPAPPTLEQLLDWPAAYSGAWPAEGEATTATLQLLTGAGIESLVLESGNVRGTAGPRVALGGFDTLVADADLGAAARTLLSGPSETSRTAGAAELAARLALAAGRPAAGAAEIGRVLALDRGTVADAGTVEAVFATLDALAWVDPTNAALQPSAEGTLRAGEVSETRVELLREAVSRSSAVDALAPLLQHPEYLTEYQRVELLRTLGTRFAAPDADLAAFDQGLRERDAALLDGVQVVPSENTQLIGSSSRVPVLVHNALPFEALIVLKVAPYSAAITVPERRFADEAVEAGGNSTVLVPVDSRVSSGSTALVVQVADTVDETVFSEVRLPLTISSRYEAILLTVLGVLAALLFGFGVWRSLRRHRLVGRADRGEGGRRRGAAGE
nr:DUF6049 family protein [Leucobacter soli]